MTSNVIFRAMVGYKIALALVSSINPTQFIKPRLLKPRLLMGGNNILGH